MKKLLIILKVLSLLACIVDGGVSMHNPFSCYSTDTIRFVPAMMDSITSYEAVRRFNFTTVDPFIPSGNPSRIWYLGRYGARTAFPAVYHLQMIEFANSSVQDDIVENYEAGRTSLCREDYEAIRNFTMDKDFANPQNDSSVLESGLIAMQNIAKRLKQKYPNILGQTYNSGRFLFRHTSTSRTNVSIRAFARGLFGEAGSRNVIYENVPTVDWLLTPHEVCPAFSQETANYFYYRDAFEQGPEFEEMIQQVNRKLGFHASNQLNLAQIYMMYTWCRFQTAALFEISNSDVGGISPWCAAFSVAHHRLWEYRHDLAYFYLAGYGVRNQRLLENLSCGLIQDLLTHMQSDDSKKARIFVTERNTILAMFVLLGSFRDVWPLHQHNFAQQSNRRWLTSLIAPFSQNLIVVRYDCADSDHDLVFLLNEKPMLVPGCNQQKGVCKLSYIKRQFQRFKDRNCANSFCSNI